jgi:heme exporter protein B
LSNGSVSWVGKVLTVARKDVISEFRTRFALNAVVMFALVTLTVVSMSIGVVTLVPEIAAALFWIVLFFAAMSGLAQVFIKEEESGTAMVLRLSGDGLVVFFGKLIFNLLLLCLLTILLVPLYLILLKQPVNNWSLFLVTLILGTIGLAGATTIIAAVVSQASIKGALFTVLSFPVLLPLLLAVIKMTEAAILGGTFGSVSAPLQVLVAYDVVMVTISVMLFDFVWRQ